MNDFEDMYLYISPWSLGLPTLESFRKVMNFRKVFCFKCDCLLYKVLRQVFPVVQPSLGMVEIDKESTPPK